MKATLTFNLPEYEEDFQSALNGHKYRQVLSDLSNSIRSKTKYAELTEEQHKVYEEIREELYKLLSEENLEL